MKFGISVIALLLSAFCLQGTESISKPTSPSQQPPGGIPIESAPQFVMFGFDDNPNYECMKWIIDFMADRENPAGTGNKDTYDNGSVLASFFTNGVYLDKSAELRALHLSAVQAGHEIGNHTQNHHQGGKFTSEEWLEEMQACHKAFLNCGIPEESLVGFRTPFLNYNTATYEAIESFGFRYDTTVLEGKQKDQDGTNFLWPYTLDNGSPGIKYIYGEREDKMIGNHPGLWVVPIHYMIAPDGEVAAKYGIQPGLREKILASFTEMDYGSWSPDAGKVTGFDWNLLEAAKLDGEEFLAMLKYSLDLRLQGNRSPMMIGAHTALYKQSTPDRRKALEHFIDYALSYPEVRIVTPTQMLDWMEHPVALKTQN